ncbi:MAG: hypothetical protein HYY17_05420 [Planctomycetes bacterium]|nr:hypothetical protein [Planctomycetota bacterium]
MHHTRRFRPRARGGPAIGPWLIVGALGLAAVLAASHFSKRGAPPEKKPPPRTEDGASRRYGLPPRLDEAHFDVDQAIMRTNACILVREIARLHADPAGRVAAEDRAREYESRLAGFSGKPINYLRVSDRVLQVDQIVLDAGDAADRLVEFYRSIYAGQLLVVAVERGGRREDVTVYFREAPRAYYGVETPPARTTPAEQAPALPVAERRRFEALPEYYREGVLSHDERDRIARIIEKGGSREELDWLCARLDDLESLAGRERAEFGEIESEARRAIGSAPEFDARLRDAEGRPDMLYELAVWCRDRKLGPHERLAAVRVLRIDPGFAPARIVAGYVRDGRTGWRRTAETARVETPKKEPEPAEKPVEFEGKKYTRAQLRSHLIERGYVEIGGKWHRKEPWEYVLDTVHSLGRFPWSGGGVTLQEAREEGRGATGRTEFEAPTTQTRKATWRFFAPAGTEGSMRIAVETPGRVIECRLSARAYVPLGKGSIEVLAGEEKPARVFLIENGSDSEFRDISPHVRGAKRVVLLVKMKMAPDREMQHARFLPSSPGDKRVFVLTGTVGVAEPKLDRLFER